MSYLSTGSDGLSGRVVSRASQGVTQQLTARDSATIARLGRPVMLPMIPLSDKIDFRATSKAIAAAGLAPAPVAASSIPSPGGYMIPASTVIAAPADISPAIAAIPGGGSTEAFDYGAPTGAPEDTFDYGGPTGAPSEEFDYGAPTGAPTEEYGDAAEVPADGGAAAEDTPTGIPTAAMAALAGAAIGLGPIGIALAAATGFIFGKA